MDLDPQSKASLVLLKGKPPEGPTITNVMMEEEAAADVALSEVNIALANATVEGFLVRPCGAANRPH